MRSPQARPRRSFLNLCCFPLMLAVVLGCLLSGNRNSDNEKKSSRDSGSSSSRSSSNSPNAELCRKYESCDCSGFSYSKCVEQLDNDPNVEKPGVRECMLKSSCASLCAGKPDACIGQSTGKGAGTSGGRSDCSNISCSKNSDCPSDCYGGCDGVRCYSF